jgi:hypothetical protein
LQTIKPFTKTISGLDCLESLLNTECPAEITRNLLSEH